MRPAKHPLEVGVARGRGRLDAEGLARLSYLKAGEEVQPDGEQGNECGEMKHGKIPL